MCGRGGLGEVNEVLREMGVEGTMRGGEGGRVS